LAAKNQKRILSTGDPDNYEKISYFSKHICLIQFEANLTENIFDFFLIKYIYLPFSLVRHQLDTLDQNREILLAVKREGFSPQNFFLVYSYLPVIDPSSPAGEVGNFPQQFQHFTPTTPFKVVGAF
jgi:hypothetical protein